MSTEPEKAILSAFQQRNERIEHLVAENKRLEQDNKKLKLDSCYEVKQAMENLHEALKPRYVRLDELVTNPGLQHVALYIFKKLDPKTLGNCRLVSREWKNCIDNGKVGKYWVRKQLSDLLELESKESVLSAKQLFINDYFGNKYPKYRLKYPGRCASVGESAWKTLGEKGKNEWYKKFDEERKTNINNFTALVRRMYTEHTKRHPDYETAFESFMHFNDFSTDSDSSSSSSESD